jgi:RNA polymerase primary sigma factor
MVQRLRAPVEPVDHLLRAAARYPLLTPYQETILGRSIRAWQDWPDGPDQAPLKIRRAGKRALDRFVCSNIRLAHSIARRYTGRGVPLEDLTQSAIAGLIKAYTRFRPEMGYRSSSYACWYARQACQLAVAQQAGVLRLPAAVIENLGRLVRSREILLRRLGRSPTSAEWAAQAEMPQETLESMRATLRLADVLSLDVTYEGGVTLADFCMSEESPGAHLHRQDCLNRLRELLETLDDLPTRLILRLRHLEEDPPSLVRIAQLLHLNRETVQRLEREGLEKLRAPLEHERHDLLEALAGTH